MNLGRSDDGQALPQRILNLHTATSQDALGENKEVKSPALGKSGTMSHGAIGQQKRAGNMRVEDGNDYTSQDQDPLRSTEMEGHRDKQV